LQKHPLDWIFEIKLDGCRVSAVFDSKGKPHLWSRNGLPLEAKFPAKAIESKLRYPEAGGPNQAQSASTSPS